MSAQPQTGSLRERLDQRLSDLDAERVASEIATASGLGDRDSLLQLRKYLGEATVALNLVEPHLADGIRILEFGSGIGFFASFLSECGYDVVELEPVGGGFEFVGSARAALSRDRPNLIHLDISIEDLDPDLHGQFDLVYSLNVLEHVPNWSVALDRACDVLTPGGKIVTSCPNYTVPFEPHFGIPLMPGAPASTARLLPARISESGLWKSLNWVTSRNVQKWADARGLAIEFRSGKLADAVERLTTDPEFGRRHGTIGRVLTAVSRLIPLARLLRRIPHGLSTPMEFTIGRP